MRLILSGSARMAFGIALLATMALAASAGAFPLRSPQVVFQYGSLTGILGGLDGGVNVAAAQVDAQNFASSSTGSTDFVLVVKLGNNAGATSVGVYNAGLSSPTLYQLFPPSALADWSVSCRFWAPTSIHPGRLTVTLLDPNLAPQGTTNYEGVTRDAFGFYIQGPGGTWYSQDSRNGGQPQVITYQGTGNNSMDLWQCYNDMPYAPSLSTFDAIVLQLQSIVPTPGVVPTSSKTWGQLKATYR